MNAGDQRNTMLLFLILAVGIVYANSLFSGFVWDDNWLIIWKQAFFSHPGNAIKILITSDGPLGGKLPYYRPFNTLTYMLDHFLWGLHPFWYHLENIMLHGIVVALFYFLLLGVFEDGRLAFFSALLFAVYPVNADAVDFISSRNTLFCAAFSMASLLFLIKGGVKWTILSLFAYFLALLSKEPAVGLPFFLLSFRLATKEEKFKTKWNAIAGFFIVTALYFVIRHFILGAFTSKTGVEFSIERLKFMAAVLFEHFRLMIFPFRLNAYYTDEVISFSLIKACAVIFGLYAFFYLSLSRKSPAPMRA